MLVGGLTAFVANQVTAYNNAELIQNEIVLFQIIFNYSFGKE